MKRVVLITSGQPSTNPRLVKEADALANSGYSVTVIYQYVSAWATEADKSLLKGKSWKALRVGGDPIFEKHSYFKTRIIFKAAVAFSRKFSIQKTLAKFANGRCSFWLEREAKKHKADLYIAHNLAALPAAFHSSKKYGAKLGYDAEDFHRNEVSDDPNDFDVRLKTYVENLYLKELDYFSTSSKLIAEAYQNIYPNLNPIVINNVFEIKHQPVSVLNDPRELKLLWFSQTIGKNRGIEDAIKAINILNNQDIELHLLGNCSNDIFRYFNELANFDIKYYAPMPGDKIFEFASKFDVGLALEPGFCFNNKIALSNKIFTYLISGLAIIASETDAQMDFISENQRIGQSFEIGNIMELSLIINNLYQNRNLVNEFKKNAYHLAQSKYNWDVEKIKFLDIIKLNLAP